MKKGAIIGIAIAIIVAGGLGIYAISNTQEEQLAEENLVDFGDEATATVKTDFGEEEGEDELGFQDEATATVKVPATVEEGSDEEENNELGFEDRATATVVQP